MANPSVVKELRGHMCFAQVCKINEYGKPVIGFEPMVCGIADRAANEIERLQAEVDTLKRMMPAHITRILYEGEG